MSNIILSHSDLDGLYSALLFYHTVKDEIQIDEIRGIDYGQDHSTLYDQYDNFFVFDFAENPGEDKTVLWVDHHLRQEESSAQMSVFEESPSCVRLMINKDLVRKDILSEEDLNCVDAVDSATFNWESIKKEDILFPNINGSKLEKFLLLNQLLRKNRKRGLLEKLFVKEAVDIDRLLQFVEADNGPKTVKYKEYIDVKSKLIEKIITDEENKYIKYFSGTPILFTKSFSFQDWKGYDLNILGYLANSSKYMIVVFDFSSGTNIQIARNMFYDGPVPSLFNIIKEEVDDPRGHEGIINISFKTRDEAVDKIDKIVALLEPHV